MGLEAVKLPAPLREGPGLDSGCSEEDCLSRWLPDPNRASPRGSHRAQRNITGKEPGVQNPDLTLLSVSDLPGCPRSQGHEWPRTASRGDTGDVEGQTGDLQHTRLSDENTERQCVGVS